MKIFKELIPYICVIIFVILLRTFIITPIQVDGESMVPTLQNNELMLLNKITYKFNKIKRFDIVVVEHHTSDPIIKRVIGLPGETVEYKNNKLYINGKYVKENFKRNGKTDDYHISKTGYDVIPKDKYFVVGDNRINSSDSRIIGLIDKKEISGKANFVIFPFNKFGFAK